MSDLLLTGIQAVADMLIHELEMEKNKISKRKKRVWTRDWILRRSILGASNNFLREVEIEDENTYKNHLRLNSIQFNHLLELVQPKIQKRDTLMRAALPARLKLQITLRYLASGDSFRSLEALYRVPKSSISKFIPSVLEAIYESLKEYIEVSIKVTHFVFYRMFNSFTTLHIQKGF